jgi:folate-dependent phosphoribosylglycinamide formyltransferase PurN
MMSLRTGILGMPDNVSTRIVLRELDRLGRRPDVLFLLDPDSRTQWRRLMRKLKAAGLKATMARVLYALKTRFSSGEALADATLPLPDTVHRVDSFNSAECQCLIRDSRLDLLILSTDTMIRRGTFSLPRFGTLNAHPGWVPKYRGLGSLLRMLEDGIQPAISVHLVDEGVDTGPLLLRRTVEISGVPGSEAANADLHIKQARMFAEAISMFERGEATPIDVFLEPSNMTRGIPSRRAEQIIKRARHDRDQSEATESRPH